MATKITAANFSPTALAAIVGPAISSVQITSSNTYATVLDDTAVSLTGGYIVLNGTGFITGCQVYLDSTVATSVTFVSSTRVNVQVPAMAAGTYVMYLLNGDGSIAIRVNGLTYSLNPTWATSSDLGSVTFGNAISLQLAAPSDTTITYTLQAGSTLPTGLTLSSAGLLSGTVSIESATTYNFTVVATDLELQDSPRTFSVSITLGDLYFKNTVLLLNGETATTNWISDASTNSFNITPAGDAKPSAFSPYDTNWSNYFDGTGDYLTLPSSANLSPGAVFTFEAWIFLPIAAVSGATIYGAGGSGQMQIGYQSASDWGVAARTTAWRFTTTTIPIVGQWNHIVVSRGGTGTNQTSLFLNGTRVANGTVSDAFNVTTSYQVGYDGGGGGVAWNGYISNLRLVPGVDVYGYTNTTITVPTAALTAIANTQLLTCQSNRFKDNSTNNFTLTRNGDVAVKSLGPFTETDIVTGSGYLDGTGDYLVTSGAALDTGAGTSDFTMECWVFNNGYSGSQYGRGIFTFYPAAGYANSRIMFRLNNGGDQINIYLYISGTLHANVTSTVLATPGAWTHLAFVRQSGTFKLYINGTIESSMTVTGVSASLNTFDKFDIGRNQDGSLPDFNGYISNFRYVKGTAVYTANFTPPTAALTAIANTSLLILQNRQGHNNSAFLDTSGNKFNITRNGNTTQGTFTPFSQAGWSNYFDGTGDYLTLPSSANLSPGSVFTFEAWIYIPAIVDSFNIYAAATNSEFQVGFNGASAWGIATRGTAWVLTSTTLPIINQWNHIVVSRGGTGTNQTSLFLNGVRVANGTVSAAYSGTSAYQIAANGAGAGVWTGYISSLRLVPGVDVYGYTNTAITVPTAALTAVANTALLTCQNNRFIDNSTNNFTLTATGDAKVQAFSPFKPSASYSAATHGGSAYFDGSGDTLALASNAAFAFGTSDFTVEGWFYQTADNTYPSALEIGSHGSTTGIVFITRNTGNITIYSGGFYGTVACTLNQWNHIVWIRASGSLKIYLNGVLGSTVSFTNNLTDTAAVTVGNAPAGGGAASTYSYSGYMSNLRVVKGIAVYTANFTPPTAPLTAITNTVLLLSGTNAGIIDASGRTDLETVGDARISTTVKKYGTGSMSFDGTGDYLYAASSPNFELSSGDFTVEAWIYPTTIAGAERGIFGIGTTDPDSNLIRIQASTSKLQFWLGGSNSGGPGAGTKTGIITCGTALSLNTWYHIALVRSGSATNNVKLYLNGVSDGQGTATYTIGAKPFSLGMGYPGSVTELFIGYIDEFRITKGVARYTATFTPPTTEVLTK